MDKAGRDIVSSVAARGPLEGKFTQSMENRRTTPIRTQTRDAESTAA